MKCVYIIAILISAQSGADNLQKSHKIRNKCMGKLYSGITSQNIIQHPRRRVYSIHKKSNITPLCSNPAVNSSLGYCFNCFEMEVEMEMLLLIRHTHKIV